MALSNKEIPTDLREYIEINILPQYATFDKAHRLNRRKGNRRKHEAGTIL